MLYFEGLTDEQVAQRIGIHNDTIYRWCKTHPEFYEARREAKILFDELIENALAQRALGMSVPDFHVGIDKGIAIITPLVKHFPPDVEACKFWLKNRKPHEWRDKTDLTHSNPDGSNLIPAQADIEAAKAVVRARK